MKVSICKLCLEHKSLCKESHIIPRFMYKLLVQENNKLVYIDSDRSKIKYNSEYEGQILCENCDSSIIGKLDSYAADSMHNKTTATLRHERVDNRDVEIRENDPNYDYDKFKLFLLSILWRSSISSRPFFQRVKLPSEIEEDIRQRILNNQPGEPGEYPCFINLPPLVNAPNGVLGFSLAHMPTMSPVYLEKGELRMCQFVIQGVHYYFLISRPQNMSVVPAIERNKLTMGFSTVKEQNELIQQILEIMKNHKKYKKA